MNRLLFELQEVDFAIAHCKRERSKLDDGTSARAERDTLQKALDAAKENLNALNTQRTGKETELQTAEEKLTRQQSRLMNASSAHEVTSLQRDIAALTKARGDLDEAILMLMDEIESAMKDVAEFEKQLADKSAETTTIEATFAAETNRLTAELAAAQSKRDETESQLDESARAKYLQVANAHQGIAVAHLENGNCSACGMTITPYNLRDAKTQTWPTCENCGRLLFLE